MGRQSVEPLPQAAFLGGRAGLGWGLNRGNSWRGWGLNCGNSWRGYQMLPGICCAVRVPGWPVWPAVALLSPGAAGLR